MPIREIVLPETKPETEWVRGRALQKVSPNFWHGDLQAGIAGALRAWARRGRYGRVASEWRFRVHPPGEPIRPLVPDVAYLSFEALPADAPPARVAYPLGAPTIAIEILSPRDRSDDVAEKISAYLAAGSAGVFVVDPVRRTLSIHDGSVRILTEADVVRHDALPGFALSLAELFAQGE